MSFSDDASAAWNEPVWLVRSANGSTVGPVSLDQVRRGQQAGQVEANVMLQRSGTSDWVPAATAMAVASSPGPSLAASSPTTRPVAGVAAPGALRDLFRLLDGTPVHVAILFGLLFALLSPACSRTHAARAESAAAELQHAQALMEIDLEEFRQTQSQASASYENAVKSAKLHVQAAQASRDGLKGVLDVKNRKFSDVSRIFSRGGPDATQQAAIDAARADVSAVQAKIEAADTLVRDEQIKAAEAESRALDYEGKNLEAAAKSLEDKRATLATTYNIKALQRADVDARTTSRGTTASVHLQWMGRLLLLAGLLVIALNATGTKQKIAAILVILALFAWLTTVRFDFLTGTQLGPVAEAAAPQASPVAAPTTRKPVALPAADRGDRE